ncbi:uncharacterized protein [Apostichopus japonicus]|uniref:uncharacterized protein n=1 Tax=Stichopus japonicus TaxID=307972 RepID=UPI003AB11321
MRLYVAILLVAALLVLSEAKPAKKSLQKKHVKDALASRLRSLAALKKKSVEKKELAKKFASSYSFETSTVSSSGSSSGTTYEPSSGSSSGSSSASSSDGWDSWIFSSWDFSSGSEDEFWGIFRGCKMGDFGEVKKRQDDDYSQYSYQSDFWQCMADQFPEWFEDEVDDRPDEKPEDRPDEKPEDRPDEKPGDRPGDRPAGKPDGKPDEKPSRDGRKSKRVHNSAVLQSRRRALLNALKQL